MNQQISLMIIKSQGIINHNSNGIEGFVFERFKFICAKSNSEWFNYIQQASKSLTLIGVFKVTN